jgi:hypothetical protein
MATDGNTGHSAFLSLCLGASVGHFAQLRLEGGAGSITISFRTRTLLSQSIAIDGHKTRTF